jgi:peptidylglycine monooxygenase
MSSHRLIVALGNTRYRVERPWGDLPQGVARITDVAVDMSGRVHALLRDDPLVDEPAPKVVTLDGEGRRISTWGDTMIADAHMLTSDDTGRLYIVDRDAHEVIICDTNGNRIGALGERHAPLCPFNHPTDLAVAANGECFVCEGYASGRVFRFDGDGRLSHAWGKIGREPGAFMNAHSIALTLDGRVVVVDRGNDRLQIFSRDGELLSICENFSQPLSVYVDADGFMYVTDLLPSLSKLSPDGTLVGRCRPVLNGAHGISGDAKGNLYLAEVNPSRLTRLCPI